MKAAGKSKKTDRETIVKSRKSSYDLRTSNVYFLHPSAKLEQEQRELIRCPPLTRKTCTAVLNSKEKLGATPVGTKGKLSLMYDRTVKKKYVEQLFLKIDKIGEGSFGSVHRYRSVEDNMCYAIKVIKRKPNDVYGEVDCLDLIDNNPYCIQYLNAWEECGMIYIQFELAIMSLADYAKRNHNICEEECWNILYDLLKALAPLHQRGLCHNDIKPDNIMITFDGKYKLCDFGLLTDVKLMSAKSALMKSEGDAKYVANEVLQGDMSTSGDIFALGISLLELSMDLLLPGYGPCWHDLRQCSWRMLPSNAKGRISFDLETIINWMMHVDPAQRPTVEQLFGTQKMLDRRRAKKPRFDYFKAWYSANCNADIRGMLTVTINLPDDQNINEPATPNSDRSLSPVTTPKQRVSTIIVRKFIPLKLDMEAPATSLAVR
ncbi:PREDICTED: membrane-associated tyrosine- and threonine-specific cdc2-inhibitory kinase-like [Nicrophorus vespilloides]|uniref:non-specific serine/threonine protein kinase n=1 Tax=Nicrophorus vespilloides TaxID=110193 RepID=A0ABM1NF58_NICVS|nr:PREDICTED: membrane-associated tyrosine- and threonine-specific cdc2-inhibitory kinase-like [Nicrophorus vespilloides]